MIDLVILNVEIFIVMKISKLSSLYATNETNPSTYQRTPSGKGLRPSFRPFCTIFLQPQEAVTKLIEFCNSLIFLYINIFKKNFALFDCLFNNFLCRSSYDLSVIYAGFHADCIVYIFINNRRELAELV